MTHGLADGAAGQRRAASLLAQAVCAEATHATMSEEGAKLDLKLSFRNAHAPGRLITVPCQVKHGASFRAPNSKGNAIKLTGIDKSTIAALSHSNPCSLLVWIPPFSSIAYAHLFRGGRFVRTPIVLTESNIVRPTLRFDISMADSIGLAPKPTLQDVASVSGPALQGVARQRYRQLAATAHIHPIAGAISVTRMGWRHVTRRSRTTAHRTLSLQAVDRLGPFLTGRPDRYLVVPIASRVEGKRRIELRDIICWHQRAMRINGELYHLRIRIREEISYPIGWERLPLSVSAIKQRATLLAWWCKLVER